MTLFKPGDWFRHDGGYPTFIERWVGDWWFFWNDSSGEWTPYARSINSIEGWHNFDEYCLITDPPDNAEDLYDHIGWKHVT